MLVTGAVKFSGARAVIRPRCRQLQHAYRLFSGITGQNRSLWESHPHCRGKGSARACKLSSKAGGGNYFGERNHKTLSSYGNLRDPTLVLEETGNKGYDVIADWLSSVFKRDIF